MKKELIRTRNLYLCASIFVGVFGFIYELFSHQVYSGYMVYAFLIPLAGGFLPYVYFSAKGSCPPALAACLYNSGIATLTVGSLLRGILDIYGTTSHLTNGYATVGFLFIVVAVIIFAAWERMNGSRQTG